MRSILILVLAVVPAVAQIDLSGEWNPMFHEDQPERIPGPEIGDYLGLPITDAARLRAEAWDAEILTLPEHQCKPHPADYGPRGPFNLRIWKEVDTPTQQIIAWHTHGVGRFFKQWQQLVNRHSFVAANFAGEVFVVVVQFGHQGLI